MNVKVCAYAGVAVSSFLQHVPSKELSIILIPFCDLVVYKSSRKDLQISFCEGKLDRSSGTEILEI